MITNVVTGGAIFSEPNSGGHKKGYLRKQLLFPSTLSLFRRRSVSRFPTRTSSPSTSASSTLSSEPSTVPRCVAADPPGAGGWSQGGGMKMHFLLFRFFCIFCLPPPLVIFRSSTGFGSSYETRRVLESAFSWNEYSGSQGWTSIRAVFYRVR